MQRVRKTYKLIFVLGILVALIPYAGFPHAWDTLLFSIVGVMIAACSLVLRSAIRSIFSGTPMQYASGEMRETTAGEELPLSEQPKRRPRRPRKIQTETEEVVIAQDTEQHEYHEDTPASRGETGDRVA